MEKQLFFCVKCGSCCRNLKFFNNYYAEIDGGDGICRYLDCKSNLCKIYDNRPLKCNVRESYENFINTLSVKEYFSLTKKGCWVLRYFEYFKTIKIRYVNIGVELMFEINLSDEQKSVFLGLLNGLILADGVISPKETEKWNFFASLFQGITYKTVAIENLKAVFITKQAKASVLLELMSVGISKENLEPEDKLYIEKIAAALDIDKDLQTKMWTWVEKMIALVQESNQFME
jgi:hypothetical protein